MDAEERGRIDVFRAEVRARDRDRAPRHRPAEARAAPARAGGQPIHRAGDPLFLADYVLMGYGNRAIMAVPGEDERDWDFAKAHERRSSRP